MASWAKTLLGPSGSAMPAGKGHSEAHRGITSLVTLHMKMELANFF